MWRTIVIAGIALFLLDAQSKRIIIPSDRERFSFSSGEKAGMRAALPAHNQRNR